MRRTNDPFKDCWNLPAGYVEAHEAPLQAVVREVHEETGLRVEPQGLAGVYYFDDDPRGNGILIVYACRPVGGALRDTREGVASAFFGVNDLPEDLAGVEARSGYTRLAKRPASLSLRQDVHLTDGSQGLEPASEYRSQASRENP
jgi:ADP-ribose pyrophosphatase YjhB (NUDIX family)